MQDLNSLRTNTIYSKRRSTPSKLMVKSPAGFPLPDEGSNEETESSTELTNGLNNKRRKKHQQNTTDSNKIVLHTSNRFSALSWEDEPENTHER